MALPSLRVSELRRREHHSSLLAAWGFDEGGGSSARDSSATGRTLTVDPGIAWVTGHTGGTALSNSGSGGAGGAYAAWNWTSPTITLMGWARPTELTAGTDRPLFGLWTTPNTTGSTQVAIYAQRASFSTPNVLQANVRVGGGLIGVNDVALTLNTWVHVAVTFDGNTIRLYKNGVEVMNFDNTGVIQAGAFNFCVVPNTAHAQVDDVRVFGAALTASQIVSFMGSPVAAP